MSYYGENGLKVYCDNGLLAETDKCPCGCPDFEGRTICYVDKHASGTGDGSSWANAYTSIQYAIDAHPKKEIQIQGYGELDAYSENIILLDCVYLKGIGDVWNDVLNWGFDGIGTETVKFENINVKNCGIGFYNITKGVFNNCTTKDVGYGFRNCNNSSFDTCVSSDNDRVNGTAGFFDCDNSIFIDCAANNNDGYNYPSGEPSGGTGFWQCTSGLFTDCASNGNEFYGFWECGGFSTFVNCTADGTAIDRGASAGGFRLCGGISFVNCTASNNEFCGWWQCGGSYTACNDINNCTNGSPSCTPGSPSYLCDEV